MSTPKLLKTYPLLGLLIVAVLMTGLSIDLLGQGVEYNSMGKRDPFVDLLKQRNRPAEEARIVPPPPLEERPPGLAGLLISEVIVTGVAAGPSQQMAIVRGVDNMTYFAREGTKLFDGYLDELAGDEIVFIREQIDTKGEKRVSRVVKRIQTEDR